MPTTLNFKDIIDLPLWRPLSPVIANTAAGSCWAYDMRNSTRNSPFNYFLSNATTLYAYSPQNDEWMALGSPALTGTFGAGAAAVFHPSAGPRGALAGGNSTSRVVISTALPATISVNQLANRGDGVGYRIRIIGNAGGSSGKVEERIITANTSGTTPTITLDTPLTFTPATGDGYEILSGRVFMLSAGTLAAGMWKFYDVATNSFSGNLATTNLPATVAIDSCLVSLSESHIPNDEDEFRGMLGALTSTTGNTGTTIATSAGIASSLFADEYRNYQIRIIQDTATPTAVGQRRRISTHTSGTTPTFTVAAWAVTPSSTAQFVVENDDDKILLFTNQTATYTYNITANTWDTSTFAAAGSAGAAGVCVSLCFGITRDTTGNARQSVIFRIRGGAVGAIDTLDISGAATGTWTSAIPYANSGTTFTTGTSEAYDPVTNGGRYLYLNHNATQRFLRFDMRNRVLEPWTYLRVTQGAALVGGKLSMSYFFDGSTKLSFLHALQSTSPNHFSIACQR